MHTAAELARAVTAARAAQPAWAALTHAERSAILHRAADEIDAHAEELAQIVAREQGKPLGWSSGRKASRPWPPRR
ncbi:aldehyde dehydrogenase family protein [Microbacterium sp. ACRRU]|uniref:aldehyde dehydrogenase family protein n=1 Tax=Microbacterium sp. ACRRU TaxID=2918204 RepID=UPI0035ABAB3F